MILLNFADYRDYLKAHIKTLPNKGRGELSKIAQHLRVNTTWISQILSGAKQFNIDQAVELGAYLDLSDIEIEYFILLIQSERAATHKARAFLKKKIESIKSESMKLQNQITFEKSLNDKEKAIFYSSWIYSAVHLFTSTSEKGVSLDEVMNRFDLKRTRAVDILNFLLQTNLCLKKNDYYLSSTQSTFIDRDSPFLLKHHSNWRIKAIEKSEHLGEEELMFTAPISLSKSDFKEIREELVRSLKKISQRVQASKSESIANLNIDWFWISK